MSHENRWNHPHSHEEQLITNNLFNGSSTVVSLLASHGTCEECRDSSSGAECVFTSLVDGPNAAQWGWILQDAFKCFKMSCFHVTDARINGAHSFADNQFQWVNEWSFAIKTNQVNIWSLIYPRIKCLQFQGLGRAVGVLPGISCLAKWVDSQWRLKFTLTSHSMKEYVEGSFLVTVSYRIDQQRGSKRSTLQGMKPLHELSTNRNTLFAAEASPPLNSHSIEARVKHNQLIPNWCKLYQTIVKS